MHSDVKNINAKTIRIKKWSEWCDVTVDMFTVNKMGVFRKRQSKAWILFGLFNLRLLRNLIGYNCVLGVGDWWLSFVFQMTDYSSNKEVVCRLCGALYV